ncbi:MAG TPA: ABC transporter permease [Streptosporangiaceae bacterium]|nr:ABC transporter permease [Streptosporangiaceae bacterium]
MVILGLAVRSVRHQPAAFAASFLTVALSAFLITVCGGVFETGLTKDIPPQRLLTAPVVVTGVQDYLGTPLPERNRLAPGLASEIAAVPGVARTVPDVSFPVTVLSGGQADGPPVDGHDWSAAQLTPYRLITGRAPTGPGDVVLDAHLADSLHLTINSLLRAQAHGTVVTLRVAGIADSATSLAPALFVTDARASALTGQPGLVDSFAVYPSPGVATGSLASRITAALPHGSALVLTGDARGRAEFPDAAGDSFRLIPLAAVSGPLMMAVAIFIVASTLGLAVQLRRRQIALLRAVGATPRQLRRLVLGQTLLVAIPAVCLGLLPTEAAGRQLLSAMANHGLVTGGLIYHQNFIPTLVGAAIAVLTGVIAALLASRGAIHVPPVEALGSDDTPQPWMSWPRLVLGLLTLAGAIALAVVTALVFNGPIAQSTAGPSAMLWALTMALLGPALLTRPVLSGLGRVAAALAPRTGHLARLTIQGRGPRTAALATPVMLATGLATALLYMQTTQQAAAETIYAQNLQASLVISSPSGGLPLGLAAQANRLPGVAASPLVTSNGFLNLSQGAQDAGMPDSDPMLGLDGATASRVANYQVTSGSLARLSGDTIAIPASWAKSGQEVGDTAMLRFGDNTVTRVRIVALFTAQRGYPVMLVPAALLAPHTSSGLAEQVLVSTAPNTDLNSLRRTLSRMAADIQVSSRSETIAAFTAGDQTSNWIYYMFLVALTAFVTVYLTSATLVATTRRRPQLHMVRQIGATGSQVGRAMAIEGALVAAAGIVLGTLVALATLLPFDNAIGAPGLPAGSPLIYLTVIALAAALTIAVTSLSARLLRTAPSQA